MEFIAWKARTVRTVLYMFDFHVVESVNMSRGPQAIHPHRC